MKVLFLAPQPFFEERGTPIAVKLALEVLGARYPGKVDLLTYHVGQPVTIPGVTIHRITVPRRLVGKVPPGFSLAKVVCDLFLFVAVFRHLVRSRRLQYQVIHAVEESVFIALVAKALFGVAFIYDMDSSLPDQIVEKHPWVRYVAAPLHRCIRWAVRSSVAVAPVCEALAGEARRHGGERIELLRDVSLLKSPAIGPNSGDPDSIEGSAREIPQKNHGSLHEEIGIAGGELIVYIGNLEHYQGIDLLIESFATISTKNHSAHLVIIGGESAHVRAYQEKAAQSAGGDRIHLIGPRPVSQIDRYVCQADILVSPRIKGSNTPMKIYSYLHSGKAIVATDLYTHQQVLHREIAELCAPTPTDFGNGMLRLLQSEEVRRSIGERARVEAETHYTVSAFARSFNRLYDAVEERLSVDPSPAVPSSKEQSSKVAVEKAA